MDKNMIRLICIFNAIIIVYGLNISLSNNIVAYKNSYGVEDVYQREKEKIKNAGNNISSGFYHIKLFSGFWPIPDRFVLDVESKKIKGNQILRFNSYGDKSHKYSNGTIIIGTSGDGNIYDKLETDKFLIKQFTKGKLNIYMMSYMKSGNITDAPKVVYIYNSKFYISIADVNPYLWEAMLDSYMTTQEKIKE